MVWYEIEEYRKDLWDIYLWEHRKWWWFCRWFHFLWLFCLSKTIEKICQGKRRSNEFTLGAGMSKSEDLFAWSLSNRMIYSARRHESILTIFKWKRRSSEERPIWIRRWASDISLAVTILTWKSFAKKTKKKYTYIEVRFQLLENGHWLILYRIDYEITRG